MICSEQLEPPEQLQPPEPRAVRRKRPRLPILSCGAAQSLQGQCFPAALLAHTLGVDLDRNTVPADRIKDLRCLASVPNRGFLLGDAQQAVAEHLGVGYVVVQVETRVASLFTVHRKERPALSYAMLVATSSRHVEPLATGAGKQCGLVSHARVLELLETWEIELAPALAGQTIAL